MFRTRIVVSAAIVLALSLGAAGIVHTARAASMPLAAPKMTNADHAREALEHLKKARASIENLTNDKKEGDAGDAMKSVDSAIDSLDKYLAAMDKKS